MSDAVSRLDGTSPDQQQRCVRAPSGAPVAFHIQVSWNSLITSLLPVHIGVDAAEDLGLVPVQWQEPEGEAEEPARWAMVVPKMDRESSGS